MEKWLTWSFDPKLLIIILYNEFILTALLLISKYFFFELCFIAKFCCNSSLRKRLHCRSEFLQKLWLFCIRIAKLTVIVAAVKSTNKGKAEKCTKTLKAVMLIHKFYHYYFFHRIWVRDKLFRLPFVHFHIQMRPKKRQRKKRWNTQNHNTEKT